MTGLPAKSLLGGQVISQSGGEPARLTGARPDLVAAIHRLGCAGAIRLPTNHRLIARLLRRGDNRAMRATTHPFRYAVA